MDATTTTPLLEASLSTISETTWAGEPTTQRQTGTIFTSTMNLAACALGASMLSLPYTMMISGPIVALEILCAFAVMAFFAAQAVVNAGLRCKKSAYANIVKYYFGTFQGIVTEILLAVALIVAAISYVVGLVDLLPDMLPFTSYLNRTSRIIAILMVLYPVTLISSLAAFGPASAIATAGCYLQALALVTQLFTSGEQAWTTPPASTWTAVNMTGLIYSLPMICFVYAFHYVLTDTLGELNEPTRMRMALVNILSVALMLGCYLPVAVAGYLVYSGKHITSNVLAGLAPGSPTAFIAKWSIGALLLITYSLFIIPLRRKFEAMTGDLTGHMLNPRRIAIAGSLNILVGIAAISLPDLGLANTIAGGCIALIMFFFPGLLMVRCQLDLPFDQRDPLRIGIGAFFVFSGSLICFIGLFGGMIFDY